MDDNDTQKVLAGRGESCFDKERNPCVMSAEKCSKKEIKTR
jgi:hypothetical protein